MTTQPFGTNWQLLDAPEPPDYPLMQAAVLGLLHKHGAADLADMVVGEVA